MRTRVVSLMLVLMAAGFLISGAVLYVVQFAQLNERVDAELEQEVDELRELARGDPANGRAPYDDLDSLFYAFLSTSVSGPFEGVMALIDGEVVYVSGGERDFELNTPEVLRTVQEEVQEGLSVVRRVDTGAHELRLMITSVRVQGDPGHGVMVVGIDVGSQRNAILDRMRTYGLIALGALVLTGLAGNLVAGRLLRPLTELRRATAEVNTDDLTRRVEVSDADTDVAELTVTFNQMLERLESGFSDQRRFLDDAAHELRTPLTIIRGNMELMHAGDDEDVTQTRDLVLDETDRMQRLVDDLLVLAKRQRPDFVRPDTVEVADLAEEMMDRVHLLGERRWVRAGEATGTIRADRQRILQAVVQLCANAVKFTRPDDTITLVLSWGPPTPEVASELGVDPGRRFLVIAVQDTGTGIAANELTRIFERFGRAENADQVEGSGLGLAIVSAIAQAHWGTVTVDSQPWLGSTFRIWIPEQV